MTSHDDTPDPLDPLNPSDPLAARLRAALTSEADMVNPSGDGLQRIRAGVDSGRRPWWQHPAALAVAAAAVLGLAAGGLAVALGGDDGEEGNVIASQTSDEVETPSPEPSETKTEATDQPQVDDVYVYYVMDDADSGPRLYREQHRVSSAGAESPVFTALAEMMSRPALDPDYVTSWPTGTEAVDYEVSGATATVYLTDFPRVGAGGEVVAVQQLVYTVTANDKRVSRVRLLVNGAAPPSGHTDWSEPVARAPMLDVQGLIWVLAPTQDASVASPVTISGVGTAFEATI
ncbi:MAG: GerMN domain-containing protein, partial [Spirochaetaceae bacterium]|nr:GerMN domain-containing protein [Spirochaetaceae bacterium]